MTSEELHKEITLMVKDRLDADQFQREGEKRVRDCPECRDAYEKELEQKMVMRERYGGESTSTVPEALEKSLEAITRAEDRRRSSYSRRSRRSGAGLPLFLLLTVILGLGAYIVLFDDSSEAEQVQVVNTKTTEGRESIPAPSRRSTGPINMFNQAIVTYESLQSDQLQVEYEDDQFTRLLSTFSEQGIPQLTFSGTTVPLKGGGISKRGETSLPYFIYEQNNMKLYVSEIPFSVLKEVKGFYVTEDVLAQLSAGENIWMDASASAKLVMYKKGDAVFVAVSNRSSIDMKKLLKLQ